jgi:hypothetical protein
VAINRVLADSLGARPGDAIVLRITKLGDVPADSPLGRRTADSWSRRLRVAEVLPAEGLGDFSLRPTQVTGGLAITSLGTAQAILRRAVPSANVLLSVSSSGRAAAGHAKGTGAVATHDAHDADILRAAVKPSLDDVGLVFDTPAASGAWRLSSRRLLLPPEADRAAERVLGPIGGRPTLAFLANAMTPLVDGRPDKASIPYSTVVGIDTTSLPVGDLVDEQGGLLAMPGPDEIVIDRWMADDLASQGVPVAVGDSIRLQYFLPETLHGRVEEPACVGLPLRGISCPRSRGSPTRPRSPTGIPPSPSTVAAFAPFRRTTRMIATGRRTARLRRLSFRLTSRGGWPAVGSVPRRHGTCPSSQFRWPTPHVLPWPTRCRPTAWG